jgi:hypothetical protein
MSEMSEREKLAAEKVKAMDEAERLQTDAVREEMLRFLLEHKGYDVGDIERDMKFRIDVSGCQEDVSTDFIINIGGRRFMAIKCAAASVDTRERHITAFARVVDENQIPLCLVTDGENTRLIDTLKGSVISEDIHSVPTKDEALKQAASMEFLPYPSERMEREKRILLAFEAVRCPNVQQ